MEAENHNHSHFLNLFKENSSQLNSMLLQNPRDDHDHHEDIFHGHYHHHQQTNVVMGDQEKRFRRMISNRESARRSRMRKKKQIEDFQMQVGQLLASNQYLNEKFMSLWENYHEIFQENAQLKEKNRQNLQEIALLKQENALLKDRVSQFHPIFMEKPMILPANYINDSGF